MMAAMRRAALIGLTLGALLVPVALAADGKPKKEFTKGGQARARAAALTAADVGPAWKPVRSASDDQSNPRCSYYDPDQSDLVEIGRYDSPDFTRADGSFVSSSTGVFKTARMAQSGFARVAVPAIARCFAELFRKAIAKPNVATILSTGPLAFPRFGDRSAAFRINATLKVPSATVPFAVDMVLFNRGQVDVGLIFLGIVKPLQASFERALVARVAARVR
jgi:hypothetical protein